MAGEYSAAFGRYCSKVCAQVRFTPDHPAITAELTGHLEDRREALIARQPDLPLQDAAHMAVEAMGDPEAAGRALDAFHGPILGWFQIWFRRVVWVVAALAILLCLPRAETIFTQLAAPVTPDILGMGDILKRYETFDIVADYAPDVVWRTEDYTFTVERAIVTQHDGKLSLHYLLRAAHRSPWVRRPNFIHWLRAEDSLGNRYPSRGEQGRDNLPTSAGDSAGNSAAAYPFSSVYDLWVTGIDRDATEVTVLFDHYGERAISLTLPLKGGDRHG